MGFSSSWPMIWGIGVPRRNIGVECLRWVSRYLYRLSRDYCVEFHCSIVGCGFACQRCNLWHALVATVPFCLIERVPTQDRWRGGVDNQKGKCPCLRRFGYLFFLSEVMEFVRSNSSLSRKPLNCLCWLATSGFDKILLYKSVSNPWKWLLSSVAPQSGSCQESVFVSDEGGDMSEVFWGGTWEDFSQRCTLAARFLAWWRKSLRLWSRSISISSREGMGTYLFDRSLTNSTTSLIWTGGSWALCVERRVMPSMVEGNI